MSNPVIKQVTALNAVSDTTTSNAIEIVGAKKVTILGQRANNGTGTSTFSVLVSIDGTNFVAYNRLITNVANTNAQTHVRAASFAIVNSNGYEFASLDLEQETFSHIQVKVTETTDGTHSAFVRIQY